MHDCRCNSIETDVLDAMFGLQLVGKKAVADVQSSRFGIGNDEHQGRFAIRRVLSEMEGNEGLLNYFESLSIPTLVTLQS